MTIVRSNPPKRSRRRGKPACAMTPPSRIVTANRPHANRTVVPDLTPEEHQRRGDAADEMFRELVRRVSRGS
ncbi:MAG TPA: hypothetical protein VGG53_10895 [Mycobacterium sp.]|uniref:hypothetical protein n=1 Tax=Mycobacterium sp. TaxID=1785 RepID=UPI002F4150BD